MNNKILNPLLLLLLSVTFSMPAFSQMKKAMTPDVYKNWNRLRSPTISDNGNTIIFRTDCETCNPTLNIYTKSTNNTASIERAKNAKLTPDGKYVIYNRVADRDTVRHMKLRKVKKEDLPKDTLVVYDVINKSVSIFPKTKSYHIPSDYSDLLVYQPDWSEEPKDSLSDNPNLNPLIIRNLLTKMEDTIYRVGSYYLSDFNPELIYELTNSDDHVTSVNHYNIKSKINKPILEGHHKLKSLAFAETTSRFAFTCSTDTTNNKDPELDLYYKGGLGQLIHKSKEDIPNLMEGWTIASKNLSFSENGTRLHFNQKPPILKKDTTILESEVVNVEVWNYKDPLLYTQQENNLETDKNKIYPLLINIAEGDNIIPLGQPDRSYVRINKEKEHPYAIEVNSKPYQKYISWRGYSFNDVYLINLSTGKKERILKKENGTPWFSPDGNYLLWFNREEGVYKIYSIQDRMSKVLLTNNDVTILNETNDQPQFPNSYGIAGWTENEKSILFYDRYDIWEIDPNGGMKPQRITKGRKQNIMNRVIKLDADQQYISRSNGKLLLYQFNHESMTSNYAYLFPDNTLVPIQSSVGKVDFRPKKAKEANTIVFSNQSYTVFPNLLITDSTFTSVQQFSDVNPQQKEYNWGQIELVKWKNEVGEHLKGLLVTPEDFDPSIKYPLLVNFYEKSSEQLHTHRAPYAHRSTINYSYYASKGYVIFNPDVTYNVGYPGESCYEDVISGIHAILDKGFIDKDKIGVQGHSWGGYQVAHLLTKTNIFACAESGAPVVNMVSAYGGIRWGSGMSRMFQYERTQSRLGGTLWEKPELYLENSPIFNMDKVTTPVLILHNDKDGAVPWYQGIEYFVAMRRLDKPAWMLNYNNEPHWPVKWHNRLDFNIRMEQFFDHYLMGKKMPKWMEEGVSPMEKGINQKLD